MGYYLLDHPNPNGRHFYTTRYKPLRVIVLHITAGLEDIDMIGRDASAEQTAQYAASTSRYVSWHAGADSDSHLDLLPASYTAWHASDYNSLSWGLEISKTDTTWADEPKAWVEATLKNAADACRPVAEKYGIPHRLLTRAQVDAGMSGFTYHMWLDPSRRSDPGRDFPIKRFFELLKGDDDMGFNDIDRMMLASTWKAVRHGRKGKWRHGWLARKVLGVEHQVDDLHDQWRPGEAGHHTRGEGTKAVDELLGRARRQDGVIEGLRDAVKQLAAEDLDLAQIEAAAQRGAAAAIDAAEDEADPKG